MCLHGFDQSGQEHSVSKSCCLAGNSESPGVPEGGLNILRHLAGQELGRENHLLGQHNREFLPIRFRQDFEFNRDTGRGSVASLVPVL